MPIPYARVAGLASLLGGAAVLSGVGLAGAVTPDYDATRDVISASQLGPYGFLVTLGLAVGGAMTIVFALVLPRILPGPLVVPHTLLVARGFGTLTAAAFLADVGPVRTASGFLHVAGFVGGSLAFGIGLFFLAVAMRRDATWRTRAPYTMATALIGLGLLGLFVALGPRYVGDQAAPLSSFGGLIQRLSTVANWSWHVVVGAWLLGPTPARVQA
jgi:hypothetical membrane protein